MRKSYKKGGVGKGKGMKNGRKCLELKEGMKKILKKSLTLVMKLSDTSTYKKKGGGGGGGGVCVALVYTSWW